MVPTISCPGTRGYLIPGNVPSLVSESLWQIPQACTLIRTSPAPGSGMGRSTSSKGPLGRDTWATRITVMFPRSLALTSEEGKPALQVRREVGKCRVDIGRLGGTRPLGRRPLGGQ